MAQSGEKTHSTLQGPVIAGSRTVLCFFRVAPGQHPGNNPCDRFRDCLPAECRRIISPSLLFTRMLKYVTSAAESGKMRHERYEPNFNAASAGAAVFQHPVTGQAPGHHQLSDVLRVGLRSFMVRTSQVTGMPRIRDGCFSNRGVPPDRVFPGHKPAPKE